MTDVFSKKKRSEVMSRIRSKNTAPEMVIRRAFHAAGFRFRLHDKRLPGRPDIVLPKHRVAVFVNGCFWHGHKDCKSFRLPKTNRKFWKEKIDSNRKRDDLNFRAIRKAGWKPLVIWECNIRKNATKTFHKITNTICPNK